MATKSQLQGGAAIFKPSAPAPAPAPILHPYIDTPAPASPSVLASVSTQDIVLCDPTSPSPSTSHTPVPMPPPATCSTSSNRSISATSYLTPASTSIPSSAPSNSVTLTQPPNKVAAQQKPQIQSLSWRSASKKAAEAAVQARKTTAHQKRHLKRQRQTAGATKTTALDTDRNAGTDALAIEQEKFDTFVHNFAQVSTLGSPHVPRTFKAWLEHRRAVQEDKVAAIYNQLGRKKDILPFGTTSIGVALRGKALATNHGAVLAQRTMWTAMADMRGAAAWPEARECKFEGDDRVLTGFGRYLPVPRVMRKDDQLWKWQREWGVDMKWDGGVGKVPFIERAFKMQLSFDRVWRFEDLSVGGVDDEDVEEDVARGWVGEELWAAIG